MGVTLHQSTLFCAIRLAASDSAAPHHVLAAVCAILVCLALPAGVAVAVARVPRRFVTYGLEDGSRFARLPLCVFAPSGVTQPRDVRLMASSIVTSYTTPAVLCAVLPFFSSVASNAVALVPEAAPAWACGVALYVSATAHAAVALVAFHQDIYRFRTSAVLGALGMLLTASFHFQIASGFRGAVDATITVQSGLSFVRALVAVAITVVEGMMAEDPTVTAACVVWSVPDAPKGLPSPPPPPPQQPPLQTPSTLVPGGTHQQLPVPPPPPPVVMTAPPPVLVLPKLRDDDRTPTPPPQGRLQVEGTCTCHPPARMRGVDDDGDDEEEMTVVYVDPYRQADDFAVTAVPLALPRKRLGIVTVAAAAAAQQQRRGTNNQGRFAPLTSSTPVAAPVVARSRASSSSCDVIDALLSANGSTLRETSRAGSDDDLLGEPSAAPLAGGGAGGGGGARSASGRSDEALFGMDVPAPSPEGEEELL